MTVEALTTTLASRGVALFLEGDALRFRAPKGALTADLKQQIAEQRDEIVDRLRESVATGEDLPVVSCRCDFNSWVDKPPREGRIRTHCGKCGRFIGYRPENLGAGGDRSLEPGRHA